MLKLVSPIITYTDICHKDFLYLQNTNLVAKIILKKDLNIFVII
jgi:hypothetical protein